MHIYNTSFPNFENFQGIEALAFATTIKVLIIDHKKDYLASVANFLQSFSFEVTPVDYAASALAILSERKDKFDIVLLDSDLSDVDTATFLRLTTNMDLLAVVMCEEDEDAILSRAFMNGAFLVVKRLLTIDVVRIMRQHAIRERINKLRRSKTASTIGEIAREEMPVFENSSHTCKGKSIDEPRKYVRKGSLDKNQASQSTENDGNNVRKKVCTEWTDELHGKFMNAINQLGEGRCYPKEILELMNVPGLTRMQVASHLQKCRNERWKVPEKRKAQILSRNQVFSGKRCQQRSMIRKFGSMPILPENPNNHHANNTLFDTIFSNGGKQIDENPMNHQIENSLAPSMNIPGLQNPGQDRPDAISGSGIIFNGSGGNIQEANNQQESFTSTVSKTTNYYYAQLSSGFPGVTHDRNIHDISSSVRYLSEHFLDFRQEIRIPEQAPPDQISNPEQHASSNYNQVSSDQSSGRDRSKKHQWGEGTSNFGGKYPSDEESA